MFIFISSKLLRFRGEQWLGSVGRCDVAGIYEVVGDIFKATIALQ
jgi:hypothetical protein